MAIDWGSLLSQAATVGGQALQAYQQSGGTLPGVASMGNRVGTSTKGNPTLVYNKALGTYIPVKRHRAKGVTGRDIKGAARVASLVKKFGYKPKFSPRKKRR